MDITLKQMNRLAAFLDKIESETYPENPSTLHSDITAMAIKHLLEKYTPSQGSLLLDVGCGQGPALAIFRDAGVKAIGITLNDEDVRICREQGFETYKMDQSFLEFDDGTFGAIWARHVIEHSIIPLFTLHEFSRVLAPGGVMYLEVPAPETTFHHERNPNHYSLFSKDVWYQIIQRSGFEIIDGLDCNVETPAGPDTFWGFLCRKNK